MLSCPEEYIDMVAADSHDLPISKSPEGRHDLRRRARQRGVVPLYRIHFQPASDHSNTKADACALMSRGCLQPFPSSARDVRTGLCQNKQFVLATTRTLSIKAVIASNIHS